MGKVEAYHKQINGTLSEEEIKAKLSEVKRQIRQEWDLYKMHHSVVHGEEIKDRALDMVLCFLIRRGIL